MSPPKDPMFDEFDDMKMPDFDDFEKCEMPDFDEPPNDPMALTAEEREAFEQLETEMNNAPNPAAEFDCSESANGETDGVTPADQTGTMIGMTMFGVPIDITGMDQG